MQDQHKHIAGYRELTAKEITLINMIKEIGTELDKLSSTVQDYVGKQYLDAYESGNEAEMNRIDAAEASEWAYQARKDFQLGLMKLTRAVAQPTNF